MRICLLALISMLVAIPALAQQANPWKSMEAPIPVSQVNAQSYDFFDGYIFGIMQTIGDLDAESEAERHCMSSHLGAVEDIIANADDETDLVFEMRQALYENCIANPTKYHDEGGLLPTVVMVEAADAGELPADFFGGFMMGIADTLHNQHYTLGDEALADCMFTQIKAAANSDIAGMELSEYEANAPFVELIKLGAFSVCTEG